MIVVVAFIMRDQLFALSILSWYLVLDKVDEPIAMRLVFKLKVETVSYFSDIKTFFGCIVL
jgi:hypothetical protein